MFLQHAQCQAFDIIEEHQKDAGNSPFESKHILKKHLLQFL